MNKEQMSDLIISAKTQKSMTWNQMGEAVGVSPTWLASACLGMSSVKEPVAQKIADLLDLGSDVVQALMVYPTKEWDKAIPNDPLIYRLYEVVGVYGETLKSVIQEQFGDGIMSAIDFSMDVEKEEDPKGDRVVITMNGKFLPYKSW